MNLHLICFKKVLSGQLIWCLFYALVLMLITEFVPNSTTRRWSFCIKFFNVDAKSTLKNANLFQIAPNLLHNLQHCRKLMQVRCQKGSSTKIHECLVGLWAKANTNPRFNKGLVCSTPWTENWKEWQKKISHENISVLKKT